jgi:hypothetical protein
MPLTVPRFSISREDSLFRWAAAGCVKPEPRPHIVQFLHRSRDVGAAWTEPLTAAVGLASVPLIVRHGDRG